MLENIARTQPFRGGGGGGLQLEIDLLRLRHMLHLTLLQREAIWAKIKTINYTISRIYSHIDRRPLWDEKRNWGVFTYAPLGDDNKVIYFFVHSFIFSSVENLQVVICCSVSHDLFVVVIVAMLIKIAQYMNPSMSVWFSLWSLKAKTNHSLKILFRVNHHSGAWIQSW